MIHTLKKSSCPQISLEFLIHEWANRYFFVANMSEYDTHIRQRYNVFWHELLGPLTPEQENVLKEFARVRKKYGYKGIIEDAFFLHAEPWDTLEQGIPAEDIALFKRAFELMEPLFSRLYKMDLLLLEERKKLCEEHYSCADFIPNILLDLEILFGAPINNRHIQAFLLVSSPRGGGGTANVGKDIVNIELSRLPLEKMDRAYTTFWHELIHASFERMGTFRQDAIKIAKERQMDPQIFAYLLELIISSFFADGALGRKYYHIPLDTSVYKYIPQKEDYQILGISEQILNDRRAINEQDIKKYMDTFEQILRDIKNPL